MQWQMTRPLKMTFVTAAWLSDVRGAVSEGLCAVSCLCFCPPCHRLLHNGVLGDIVEVRGVAAHPTSHKTSKATSVIKHKPTQVIKPTHCPPAATASPGCRRRVCWVTLEEWEKWQHDLMHMQPHINTH
jgi:hypothetical protein